MCLYDSIGIGKICSSAKNEAVIFRALAWQILARSCMQGRLFWESLMTFSSFDLIHRLPLPCSQFTPLFKYGQKEKLSWSQSGVRSFNRRMKHKQCAALDVSLQFDLRKARISKKWTTCLPHSFKLEKQSLFKCIILKHSLPKKMINDHQTSLSVKLKCATFEMFKCAIPKTGQWKLQIKWVSSNDGHSLLTH